MWGFVVFNPHGKRINVLGRSQIYGTSFLVNGKDIGFPRIKMTEVDKEQIATAIGSTSDVYYDRMIEEYNNLMLNEEEKQYMIHHFSGSNID